MGFSAITVFQVQPLIWLVKEFRKSVNIWRMGLTAGSYWSGTDVHCADAAHVRWRGGQSGVALCRRTSLRRYSTGQLRYASADW